MNNELCEDDIIFYKNDDDQIIAGGFTINSCFMKNNFYSSNNLNSDSKELLKDFSIPAGLLSLQNKVINKIDSNDELEHLLKSQNNSDMNNKVICDKLYTKLINIAQDTSKTTNKKTKSKNKFKTEIAKQKNTKKTKKQKIKNKK